MEISSCFVVRAYMSVNEKKKPPSLAMVVCIDKWVEYKGEERIFSMFIQSFLELTDEQFTYTHLHNRHLFKITEGKEEKK